MTKFNFTLVVVGVWLTPQEIWWANQISAMTSAAPDPPSVQFPSQTCMIASRDITAGGGATAGALPGPYSRVLVVSSWSQNVTGVKCEPMDKSPPVLRVNLLPHQQPSFNIWQWIYTKDQITLWTQTRRSLRSENTEPAFELPPITSHRKNPQLQLRGLVLITWAVLTSLLAISAHESTEAFK